LHGIPLTSNTPSSSFRSRLRTWLALALVACVFVGVVSWLQSTQNLDGIQTKDPVPETRKQENLAKSLVFSQESELPRLSRPNLVGPDACAECHKENYEGFVQTKHPFTCRPVLAETMPPGFEPGKNQLQSIHPHVKFAMSREGSHFYQTSYHSIGGTTKEVRSQLDLVLGAGGVADDVFLSWKEDGHLWELPMAWLYPTQEWALSHFDPHKGGEFSRSMTTRCMECHNTWIEHVVGSVNQYRREGALLGVTCEVCHGPGGDHVAFHKANPTALIGEHIVRATQLERERHIEVCTQCHSNAMRAKEPAFHYRSGEPLEKSFGTLETQNNEDDHVANQIKYLKQSKCFQSNDTMTCVTCHNPHQPSHGNNSGSVSCAQCHKARDCLEAERLPIEVRGDCVSCHMPSYLKINVNFQTSDDNYVPPIRRTEHRIAVHPHAREETLWKHYAKQATEESQRLANDYAQKAAAHFLEEAKRCQEQHRFLGRIAALREVVRFVDTEKNRESLREAVKTHTYLDDKFAAGLKAVSEGNGREAIRLFEELLEVNPRDAKAHGRLGTEYAKIGQRDKAISHLEIVGQIDPNEVYGIGMLAWLAFLEGRNSDSLGLYEQAELLEPREAKLKYQKGLVYSKMGKIDEAIQSYKQTLNIEPLHANAMPALLELLVRSGKATEAIPFAERSARSIVERFSESTTATPSEYIRAFITLGEVYRASGLTSKAKQAFEAALPVAKKQEPQMAFQLEQAIKSL
jgi:tetratricopeptide (TPR) repeat protein